MQPIKFEEFHNELSAVLTANLPLVAGQNHRLTSDSIGQLEQQLSSVVGDSQELTAEQLMTLEGHESLPKWYCAALRMFSQTDSMLPILEGLSIRPVVKRNAAQSLRWAFVYLIILILILILSLTIFHFGYSSALQDLKEDILLNSGASSNAPSQFDVLLWLPNIIFMLVLGFTLVLLWIIFGGSAHAAFWLGGRGYSETAISVAILRLSQSLVEGGMDPHEAAALGFSLTGASPNVKKNVISAIDAANHPMGIEQTANYYDYIADRRLSQLRIVTPILLTSILGGALTLIYCWIVFGSITTLLNDLLA